MGLLDGLVSQIASQALGGAGQQNNAGGMLGNVLGGLMGGNQQNAGGNILGSLLGAVTGGGQQGAGISPALIASLAPMVLGWVQQQGGLGNVMSSLSNLGLGAHAQSWVGTGANQPVDPSHMTSIFGADQIAQVAANAGVGTADVSSGLASLLPTIINQLTPSGNTNNAADANNEIGQVLSQLKGLLG